MTIKHVYAEHTEQWFIKGTVRGVKHVVLGNFVTSLIEEPFEVYLDFCGGWSIKFTGWGDNTPTQTFKTRDEAEKHLKDFTFGDKQFFVTDYKVCLRVEDRSATEDDFLVAPEDKSFREKFSLPLPKDQVDKEVLEYDYKKGVRASGVMSRGK